ncbi:MAG: hypothetical protein LBL49_00020 [Clostridiales Family XIII bacterium]|jgi:hypothetical protein|nr:hypothetical protein [Clostridiales Family XIII bacterium]
MEKINYTLHTLSSLIVSPRANTAFYKELGGFQDISGEVPFLAKDKLKLIYPFYQYGEYIEYAPENAVYYLPGSSVKGALFCGSSIPGGFMVDDVAVQNSDIVLRNLNKLQFLEDEQKACIKVFFENVGVEMIKAGSKMMGEFYIKDRESAEQLLTAASKSTNTKLYQMLNYLRDLEKRGYSEDLLCKLKCVIDKLSCLLDANDIFLFGGYKGLLHSMELKGSAQEIAGAVYLDPYIMLPHGLARIKLCNA